MNPDATDLLVIGGGPIGLAVAVEAAMAGLSTRVVEPRLGPVDKACGEGLMPGTVAALQRLGVTIEGAALSGIRYIGPDGSASATHLFRSGPGRGVRRTGLHAALSLRADQVGVRRCTGRATALWPAVLAGPAVQVRLDTGEEFSGGWLFGCDGLHSFVRRQSGLDRGSDGRRFGIRRHARLAPWSDLVEVHWSSGGEAYVTPISDSEIGVAILGPRGWRYDEALASFPALARRLAGAEWTTPARGAGPLRQKVAAPVRGRVLLVGDAAGYVDALTGEGLRIGLACAEAAVRSVRDGRPQDYARHWRSLTREYRWLTTGLVTATRLPAARRALVPIAGRLPRVFGAAVEALAG